MNLTTAAAIADRAHELAESYHNGNRSTVADELTGRATALDLTDAGRAALVAATLQRLTGREVANLTAALLDRAE